MNIENMALIEIIYWISTIIGGTIFILRMILMFVAGDIDSGDFEGDFHGDVHFDGDVHVGDGDFDGHHGDTDIDFKLLSLQGLTAFFMMFGLVGLALLSGGFAVILTVLGGAVAGMFTVWVISLIFAGMRRLQSEGTIQLDNAIGESGTVYLNIPANGTGKVRVTVQGSLKIYEAVSANKKKIPTGENVHVVDVIGGSTLVVEKR